MSSYLKHNVCLHLKDIYMIDSISLLIKDSKTYAVISANNESFEVDITQKDKTDIYITILNDLRTNPKIKMKGE